MLDYRNIADTSFFFCFFFTRLLLIVDAGVAGCINVLMVKIFVIVLRGPFGKPASGETSGGAEGFFCLML